MISRIVIISIILSILGLNAGIPTAFSQSGSGLDQLLVILKSKGVLTPAEIESIQRRLEEDRATLEQKEKELNIREKELNGRERALSQATDARQAEGGQGPNSDSTPAVDSIPAGADPVGETMAKTDSSAPDAPYTLRAPGPHQLTFRPGILLQTDYRAYDYENGNPNNNSFDIRRARLLLSGDVLEHFHYGFQYEFQGAGSRNLLDALVDIRAADFLYIRLGQFKEPFGLEQSTSDKNLFLTERSMGYTLTPQRDVGAMVHATVLEDRLTYGLGIFNGDGLDDSTGGDVDTPQLTTRIVLAPFKNSGWKLGENLQLGGSLSYADIDRNNVVVQASTAGGTEFLGVSPNAKFAIVQDADRLIRYGAELGWALGPLGLMAEYVVADFGDVETSNSRFDLDLQSYYIAILWMLTGEHPGFQNGVLQPISPAADLWHNGWGALGLSLRYDSFRAGSEVYNLVSAGDSVREATAYTVALNWYLNRFARLALEFTRTEFDQPLLIDRDAQTGDALFSDYENVFKARFQFAF